MKKQKILIGGCSSIGKTTISNALGAHFGIECFSLDKIRKLSNHSIFRELYKPNVWNGEVEDLITIIKKMSIQLEPAIVEWCNTNDSGILEGEGIEPEVVNSIEGVKSIFIIETNIETLHSTLSKRAEKYRALTKEQQAKVVTMNAEYSKTIQKQADKFKYPWVYSQPWTTLEQRLVELL